MKYFKDYIKESISHSVPKSLIQEIMFDIKECKEDVLKLDEEIHLILSEATSKYDIFFLPTKLSTSDDSPIVNAYLTTGRQIVIKIDEEMVFTKWELFLKEVETHIVHEYTHKIEFDKEREDFYSDKEHAKHMEKRGKDIRKDDDSYYSSREEIVAYANETMYNLRNVYGLNDEELKELLAKPMELPCKDDGCDGWNRYFNEYYGTEIFEWFLKSCYEYLDKKQKHLT